MIDSAPNEEISAVPRRRSGTGSKWGLPALLGLMILIHFASGLANHVESDHPAGVVLDFFDNDMTIPLTREHLPESISGWQLDEYEEQERTHNSDLGRRSDVWKYRSDYGTVTVSFDQTFPGWHELTECYCKTGWEYTRRTKVNSTIESTGHSWPYVELDLEKPDDGHHAFVIFSHFNIDGIPYGAPEKWGGLEFLAHRVRNRLPHDTRQKLFSGEAYQSQLFFASGSKIDEPTKNELRETYLWVREHLRVDFVKNAAARRK